MINTDLELGKENFRLDAERKKKIKSYYKK